jgi:uncharacterized protein (DUF305 family)
MRHCSLLLRPLMFILAATAAAACDSSTTSPEANPPDNVNRAYIDAIVPHHEMASMMADEAIAKAVHPGLRTMAQQMKQDQSQEVALFRTTRVRLFESDDTPDPAPMQPIPAGPNFDRIWLERMIQHHQGAIDQSLLALSAGVTNPLDSLARHTIEEQRVEQIKMRDSIRVWYGSSP